jgi:hypothetical protein
VCDSRFLERIGGIGSRDNYLPLGNLRLFVFLALPAPNAIPSAIIDNWNTTLVDMAALKIVTSRNVTDLYSVHRSIETSR